MLSLVFIVGCATLFDPGPTRRVSPSTAGVELDIPDLRESSQSYRIFYSGPNYNPSAILFIRPQAEEGLETAPGWKEVESKGQLDDLLSRIDILEPKLWSIVPSGRKKTSPADILAYIYTPGYASVRTRSREGFYLILPVPEQFNPYYYDPVFNDQWGTNRF